MYMWRFEHSFEGEQNFRSFFCGLSGKAGCISLSIHVFCSGWSFSPILRQTSSCSESVMFLSSALFRVIHVCEPFLVLKILTVFTHLLSLTAKRTKTSSEEGILCAAFFSSFIVNISFCFISGLPVHETLDSFFLVGSERLAIGKLASNSEDSI